MEISKAFDQMFEEAIDDMTSGDNSYAWINPTADEILKKYDVKSPNGMYFTCRGFLMCCQYLMARL